MLTIGTIIFYKDLTALTSRIQQIVLGIPYSHNSIFIGNNQLGRLQEFEANLELGTTTFYPDPLHRELYSINAPQEIIIEVLNQLIDDFEERVYGFIQWPAIGLRRLFEILGFKNAKSWNILWGWGVVCSELIYYYLYKLALRMDWDDLLAELKIYNPNLFHPGDTKIILKKFPKYFFLII